MASVWKRKPADPAAFERALRGKPDFTAAGRLLGMDTETVQVSPAVTGSGQLPLILLLKEEPDVLTTAGSLAGRRRGGGMRYVVLAEVRQGEAVVLDPLVGRITLPVTDLIESAAETGIFWRPAS